MKEGGRRKAGGGKGGFFGCLLLSAFCLLLLSGCRGSQSALDPAGAQAGRIGQHLWMMLYVLGGVYLIVMAFLVAAVLRPRGSSYGDSVSKVEPDTGPDAGRERRMSRVVLAGIAATVAILFALLVSSFLTGRDLYSVSAKEHLTIKVIGHQWWWEVRYDNRNPSLILTTANEIHIPVGQSVLFKLTSNDVIHSFWVPNLNGKTDLIPGHETLNWIRADRPGIYRGQCAEFCGYQHAHMGLRVIAESPEQFKAWYDSQLAPAREPSTPGEARGREVFLSAPCIMCHRVQGTTAGGTAGPDLTHVASRGTIAAGTLENTRGHLAGWVTDSQKIKPGNRMPPNNLEPQDLRALLDYLQSLK
ncbi:MAG TPA: cytochrome c oxidase subunit II [Pyrinomonadaceae bacterium]|nr:cytochrome c oxidase subunit II [Pyrinomonadaceae bacterium]